MHSFFKKNTGVISITALVFMGIFTAVLTGMLSNIVLQKRLQVSKEQGLSALEIAEGGLDYYKWFLAHYPTDIQDGTGVPGPYVHDYIDPEATTTGKFSLDVTGNFQCGQLARVDIVSTGWTNENPDIKKTVQGGYMRPSVAKYSYVLNSPVFAGASRTIYGPYHSNGGIHFAGTNFSSVTSAVATWNCTSGYGCSPASTSASGVVKNAAETNPNTALWKWPVPQISFGTIAQDLDIIFNKNVASTTPSACVAGQGLGCYFPKTTGTAKGYHVVLKSDGNFDLYRVNATEPNIRGCSGSCGCPGGPWVTENSVIASASSGVCPIPPTAAARTFLGTYTPPTACKLIYIADNVWLEGSVEGKITIIAASSTSLTFNPDIYLRDNIVYVAGGAEDGLTALAENNVLVPVDSPDNFTTKGIFIAQLGYFGRNYYRTNTSCSTGLPTKYNACVIQNQMNILGTVVSNLRTGTAWGSPLVSGYNFRVDDYDSSLTASPPPLTPFTSDQYEFVTWSQNL